MRDGRRRWAARSGFDLALFFQQAGGVPVWVPAFHCMRWSIHASSIRLLPVCESLRVAVIRPAAGSRHRSDFALWSWMGCGPRRACLASLPARLPASANGVRTPVGTRSSVSPSPARLAQARGRAKRSERNREFERGSIQPRPIPSPSSVARCNPSTSACSLAGSRLSPSLSICILSLHHSGLLADCTISASTASPPHPLAHPQRALRHQPPARASNPSTRTASIGISRPAFSYGRPACHATLARHSSAV